MRRSLLPLLATGLLAALALGCNQTPKAAGTAIATPKAAPPAAPTQPPAEVGPEVSTKSYDLTLTPDAAGYQAGKQGQVGLTLATHGEWHVNQDYPIRVSRSGGDGLAFPKPELVRADAKTFTEKSASFEVPFTPSAAGDHPVKADVSFAVCTDETCLMQNRTVALKVAVK